MIVTYTGKQGELPPDQQNKLDAKFAKLAKLVERPGDDKAAHVAVTVERRTTNVEISVNFYDHALACDGSGPDFLTAVTSAVDKLEQQLLKVRAKWRDGKRSAKGKGIGEEGSEAPALDEAGESGPRIFRVDGHEHRKPMTLEEALLSIDGKGYVAYRDADQDCISVLIRRPDGNFDLVEG